MSHHVHRRNDKTTDKTANLLISSNVHYVHVAEIIIITTCGSENSRLFFTAMSLRYHDNSCEIAAPCLVKFCTLNLFLNFKVI